MAIKYEKIDIIEKSAGLYNATTKITIDDFVTPHETTVVLEYRPDRSQYYKSNLEKETDEFVASVKKIEADKAIDISKSLDEVTVTMNKKYGDISKVIEAVNP